MSQQTHEHSLLYTTLCDALTLYSYSLPAVVLVQWFNIGLFNSDITAHPPLAADNSF